jgi:geranylgeranyl diphosphate synthase type I
MSSVVGEMSARGVREQEKFEQFVAEVRALVDARLGRWLDGRVAEARVRGAEVGAVADAMRQLVLRGGKRMRGVLLVAAYQACGGEGGANTVLPAAAAMELLQGYLLTHDDWMDGDDMRRGGPSVPAAMRAKFDHQDSLSPPRAARGQPVADAASVLAGDLAAGWALASLLELTIAPARVVSATRELARVQEEVVQGQILDVCGVPGELGDVETTYLLKTASYTVRGPLRMGACLAGADAAQLASLGAFAEPLGIAFQLRDDVLGTFGDPRITGKPWGNDLRKGKRTALVLEAMRDPTSREVLERVLGRSDASEDEMHQAVTSLEVCGARGRVEERISALVRESRAALDRAPLTPSGRALLVQAAAALTDRER